MANLNLQRNDLLTITASERVEKFHLVCILHLFRPIQHEFFQLNTKRISI